jgi:hypothetical protein
LDGLAIETHGLVVTLLLIWSEKGDNRVTTGYVAIRLP